MKSDYFNQIEYPLSSDDIREVYLTPHIQPIDVGKWRSTEYIKNTFFAPGTNYKLSNNPPELKTRFSNYNQILNIRNQKPFYNKEYLSKQLNPYFISDSQVNKEFADLIFEM